MNQNCKGIVRHSPVISGSAAVPIPEGTLLSMLDQTIPSTGDSWNCPASKKSLRTKNPIRAIVDPIVSQVQSGAERGDGKDTISLAVRLYICIHNSIVRSATIFLHTRLLTPIVSIEAW